jgi:hypothetical protein
VSKISIEVHDEMNLPAFPPISMMGVSLVEKKSSINYFSYKLLGVIINKTHHLSIWVVGNCVYRNTMYLDSYRV